MCEHELFRFDSHLSACLYIFLRWSPTILKSDRALQQV